MTDSRGALAKPLDGYRESATVRAPGSSSLAAVVLCPIDFFDTSTRALPDAAALASRYAAKPEVMHVVSSRMRPDERSAVSKGAGRQP